MRRNRTVIPLAAVCLSSAAFGQDGVDRSPAKPIATAQTALISRKQIRALIHNAHTAEDHDRLAEYYSAKAHEYKIKAFEQQQLLTQSDEKGAWSPSKYPTRKDTARSLADYYQRKEHEASVLASEHSRTAEQLRRDK